MAISPSTGTAAAVVFAGDVMHARLSPKRHAFRYPLLFFAVDIDRLPELDQSSFLFGHNRIRAFSIHDDDFLPGAAGSLRARVGQHLAKRGFSLPGGRIELVTVPRLCGYAFNPVSFFHCFDEAGRLETAVVQVNNTFGETHLYILEDVSKSSGGWIRRKKLFHVSPFFDRMGNYAFSLHSDWNERGTLDIRIDLEKEGKVVFVSRMWGTGNPFSTKALLEAFRRRPFSPWLAMPRIVWQAWNLRMKTKLRTYPRPLADSTDTIRTSTPSYIDQICRALLRRALSQLKHGSLTFRYPNGQAETFGDMSSALRAEISVKNTNLFTRVITAGDIGFGESFMAGEWDSPDLTRVLQLFAENVDVFNDRRFLSTVIGQLRNRLRHFRRKNILGRSQDNIKRHYDLSNDFFKAFLDPSMVYSSALYRNPDDTLEQAQRNKMAEVLRLAALSPGMHILEIGSGWGSLAIFAAQEFGVKVTGLTLSQEQLEYAKARAASLGLSDRVEFLLCDYRTVSGSYDRIVSVEMIEAVGSQFFGDFFAACERALAPAGLMVLQLIAIPEQRYEEYRRSCDWIQKHIFPGGELPSLEALLGAMRRSSRLVVEATQNIAGHYARTLKEWRHNFLDAEERIAKLGFDEEFRKKWLYYLCYCEAAFATRYLATYQLVLTRERSSAIELAPGYPKPPGRIV